MTFSRLNGITLALEEASLASLDLRSLEGYNDYMQLTQGAGVGPGT
jgi:hypothetical protein